MLSGEESKPSLVVHKVTNRGELRSGMTEMLAQAQGGLATRCCQSPESNLFCFSMQANPWVDQVPRSWEHAGLEDDRDFLQREFTAGRFEPTFVFP